VSVMERRILDTVENGIFITGRDLKIRFWNRWLAIHSGKSFDEVEGKLLEEIYPDCSFDLLKRKINISLKLNATTFVKSMVEKYIIPIDSKKITKSIFRHMRQDCSITPVSAKEVSVVVYNATPLLEARSIIDRQMEQLERQAKIDGLTQCYNKNMFNELLSREVKRTIRYGHILTLVIFDIDNFKRVNDTYGHLVGDHVLKEMAAVVNQRIRKSDILARWGGEEFCLLLPETDAAGGAVAAEKIRQAIEAHDFGPGGRQQCSFGVAEYVPGMGEDGLIANADNALYQAKKSGKNRVIVYEETAVRQHCPT
jgi:diguanylate cyclase (GGDEF)-like protein